MAVILAGTVFGSAHTVQAADGTLKIACEQKLYDGKPSKIQIAKNTISIGRLGKVKNKN
jgi:hypothetical protein